jgi:hypothetical protein
MTKLVKNLRVLIVAVLIGVIISVSYYVARPLDSTSGAQNVLSPVLRPLASLSLLTIVPRIFIARIVWEALGVPEWIGEALFFVYWPCLGALLGISKHWVLWATVILTVNIGLLAWFLYALSRMKIMF